jgi:hypothetical protein
MAIPGVKQEMIGTVGIDNGFQYQLWQCFAESFNDSIGRNFTSGDDAVVRRMRPALPFVFCFRAQSSFLLARRLRTNLYHLHPITLISKNVK